MYIDLAYIARVWVGQGYVNTCSAHVRPWYTYVCTYVCVARARTRSHTNYVILQYGIGN